MMLPSESPAYKYLFGPVPSRRLGRSLGVDLLLPKTCTESCVFCQIGRTPQTTLQRKDYVPVAEVVGELRRWFEAGGRADVVTLSGSGEPTLHSHFGEVPAAVQRLSETPTALLSNGTLFWIEDVRRQAVACNLVKVSVSAWDQQSFEKINRPHPDLQFQKVIDGLRQFRLQFRGELWVEVFVVPGINASEGQMEQIARTVKRLAPDRVHLNTAVRPPAEKWVEPVATRELDMYADMFSPAGVVVADVRGAHEKSVRVPEGGAAAIVLQVLERRGMRIEDLVLGLELPRDVIEAAVKQLEEVGLVQGRQRRDEWYYLAKSRSEMA